MTENTSDDRDEPPDEHSDEWQWFLAGFNAAAEGWNPDVLVDWDRPTSAAGQRLREEFEGQWPDPRLDVRTAEERADFRRRVEEDGLFGALPKTSAAPATDEELPDRERIDRHEDERQ